MMKLSGFGSDRNLLYLKIIKTDSFIKDFNNFINAEFGKYTAYNTVDEYSGFKDVYDAVDHHSTYIFDNEKMFLFYGMQIIFVVIDNISTEKIVQIKQNLSKYFIFPSNKPI